MKISLKNFLKRTLRRLNFFSIGRVETNNIPYLISKKFLVGAIKDDSTREYEFIESLIKIKCLDERAVHAILNEYFLNSRYADILKICNHNINDYKYVKIFNLMRVYRINQIDKLDPNWIEIAKSIPENHFLNTAMTAAIVECYTRQENWLELKLFIQNTKKGKLNMISFPSLKGVFNFGFKVNDEVFLKELMDKLNLNEPDRDLYFLDSQFLLGQREKNDVVDWKSLIKTLQSDYPWVNDQDRKIFTTVVVNSWDKIDIYDETDLLSARFDPGQRLRLLTRIREAVASGTALSLIRLGDGESYAFPPSELDFGQPDGFYEQDRRRREYIWWGQELDDATSENIRDSVYQAIQNASILGVPSVHRIIRDLGRAGKPIMKSPSFFGIANVLVGVSNLPQNGRWLAEERCHQFLFNKTFIEDISSVAKHLVIVSCWSEKDLNLTTHCSITFIQVSPHQKVAHLTPEMNNDERLFENYTDISEKVAEISEPNVCVLVAAGIIGKIFIERARLEGAVSLDIGAIVDYIAGHKTRSIADLI